MKTVMEKVEDRVLDTNRFRRRKKK